MNTLISIFHLISASLLMAVLINGKGEYDFDFFYTMFISVGLICTIYNLNNSLNKLNNK